MTGNERFIISAVINESLIIFETNEVMKGNLPGTDSQFSSKFNIKFNTTHLSSV
jgi:hypothetical protein